MAGTTKTKFDRLHLIFVRLVEEWRKIQAPELHYLCDSLQKSLDQASTILDAEEPPPVTRSMLAQGMEQGLREMPLVLGDLHDETRTRAIRVFNHVVNEIAPEFFERDRARLRKIMERGRVRNEAEWYQLRHRLDEIEGESEYIEEISKIYSMLGAYESSA
ncbi:MAG: hypothetical protein QNJ73_07725 [Gammaproteobacteria bacterium]|nr:hypothetical protein [Gammaproteobacteria bacterium]